MKDGNKILIGSLVIAVLLVAAAYKFFYSADVEKAEQVEAEINTKQARLNELTEKNSNRMRYDAGIVDSKDIIDTILSIYGPGNTPEKSIMMIVDLCKKTGISVSEMAFQEGTVVYSSESLDENGEPEIQIYKGGLSLNLSSGYTQLKKLTDYINSYPERMNAENFGVSFDQETGRLNVSMKINLYSVVDENHEYVDPVVEDIELGSANIFKTIEEEVVEEELDENGNPIEPVAPGENAEPAETQD